MLLYIIDTSGLHDFIIWTICLYEIANCECCYTLFGSDYLNQIPALNFQWYFKVNMFLCKRMLMSTYTIRLNHSVPPSGLSDKSMHIVSMLPDKVDPLDYKLPLEADISRSLSISVEGCAFYWLNSYISIHVIYKAQNDTKQRPLFIDTVC